MPASPPAEGPKLALGVSSYVPLLKVGRMSTADFLDAAARHGFRRVELCDKSVDDAEPFRTVESMRMRGLEGPSIGIRNEFTDPGIDLEAQVRHVVRWIEHTERVGARIARVFTGHYHVDAVAAARVQAAFDRLVPIAIAHRVHLAIETHGGLSNDPEFMLRLIDRYPDHACGICLDSGNLDLEKRHVLVDQFAPHATHVHLKAHGFDAEGQEVTRGFEHTVRRLLEHRYGGCWVVEYEGPPPYDAGVQATVTAFRRQLGLSLAVESTQATSDRLE